MGIEQKRLKSGQERSKCIYMKKKTKTDEQ